MCGLLFDFFFVVWKRDFAPPNSSKHHVDYNIAQEPATQEVGSDDHSFQFRTEVSPKQVNRHDENTSGSETSSHSHYRSISFESIFLHKGHNELSDGKQNSHDPVEEHWLDFGDQPDAQ